MHQYWTSSTNLLMHILKLLAELSNVLRDDFRAYLPELLPRCGGGPDPCSLLFVGLIAGHTCCAGLYRCSLMRSARGSTTLSTRLCRLSRWLLGSCSSRRRANASTQLRYLLTVA